jgi:hypothetical protein
MGPEPRDHLPDRITTMNSISSQVIDDRANRWEAFSDDELWKASDEIEEEIEKRRKLSRQNQKLRDKL